MGGTSNRRAPLVSVCLPSFNYARFLPGCLAGVLCQTLPDWELVAVDDASTDSSWSVLAAHVDPRFHLERHEVNLGAIATWNHCLRLARAPYVAFLCADDLFYPSKLERLVAAIDAIPSVGLVHAEGDWLDEQGRPAIRFSKVFPSPLQAHLSADHVSAGSEELRRLAAGYNYVHLSSALFRRDLALQSGGFDPRYPYAADWELWLRLAALGDVAYLNEPLAGYRRHAANLTLRLQASGQEFRDWYAVTDAAFARWPDGAGDPSPVRQEARRVIREHLLARVHAAYARGSLAEVRRELRLAFGRDPSLLHDPLTVFTYVKSLPGMGRLKAWIGANRG